MSHSRDLEGAPADSQNLRGRAGWRRLPVRVSVRALLLLILALSCVFGWVAHRAYIQREAVATITAAGGEAWFDWQVTRSPSGARRLDARARPQVPGWLFEFMGPYYFGHIETVRIGPKNRAAVLEHVSRLTRLRSLRMHDELNVAPLFSALLNSLPSTGLARIHAWTQVGDLSYPAVDGAILKYLEDLTQLENLDLPASVSLTDADLVHVRKLAALKRLDLQSRPITDTGVGWLKNLTGLKSLSLRGTQVSTAGLKCLAGMSALAHLDLSGTRVDSLAAIAHLKALDQLDLSETPLDDAGLAPIAALTSLVSLDLTGTKITSKGLICLRNLRKLDRLHLSKTQVDDNAGPALAELRALTTLRLDETQITDAALAHLARLPKLSVLSLRQTGISDAGLATLGACPLSTLWLQETRVSSAGVKAYRKANPYVRVGR